MLFCLVYPHGTTANTTLQCHAHALFTESFESHSSFFYSILCVTDAEVEIDRLEELFAALLEADIPYVEDGEAADVLDEEEVEDKKDEDERQLVTYD